MTIQYASDLHLEFPENRTFIQTNPIKKAGDILILAGDTRYLNGAETTDPILNRLSEQFEKVYLIPGNHEFYRQSTDVSSIFPDLQRQIQPNMIYLNNRSVVVGNAKLIFTTLWTAVKDNPALVEFSMNDFNHIRYQGRRFTVADQNNLHEQSFAFLQRELSKPTDSKKIVVTHHVPVPFSVASNPHKDELREAYYVDMATVMEKYGVDHWIHGHNHWNLPSYEYKGAMIHTNQLGYVFTGQGKDFIPDKTIKL